MKFIFHKRTINQNLDQHGWLVQFLKDEIDMLWLWYDIARISKPKLQQKRRQHTLVPHIQYVWQWYSLKHMSLGQHLRNCVP